MAIAPVLWAREGKDTSPLCNQASRGEVRWTSPRDWGGGAAIHRSTRQLARSLDLTLADLFAEVEEVFFLWAEGGRFVDFWG
jgi:hypothetical protein